MNENPSYNNGNEGVGNSNNTENRGAKMTTITMQKIKEEVAV